MHFKGGSNVTINGIWIEQGTGGDWDLRIDNGARGYLISGLLVTSAACVIGNVVLGNITGTTWLDRCQNVTFENPRFGFCDVIGLVKYTSCTSVELRNPSFKNNGGKGIAIQDGILTRTILSNVNWFPEDAATTIGTSNRIVDPTTLASHRERVREIGGDTAAPLVGTITLDMSTWLTVPRLLASSTSAGSVTIILPVAAMVGETITVWQQLAANQTDINAGAGVIDGVVGITTISTAYSKITVQNVGALKWITI
jgi:hypothetical protein